MESLLLEFLLTFILLLVILISIDHTLLAPFAPYTIGLTVGLEAYFAGPICGASMNPARSLGPAVVQLNFDSLWLYILAPIAGSLFAVLVFKFVKQQFQLR